MSESLEELKAIIDNAPRCGEAKHIDDDGDYIRFNYVNGLMYYCRVDGWCKLDEYDFKTMRSLSDIKRIIELMEVK